MSNLNLILHVEDREEDVFLLEYAFKQAQLTNPVHVAADGQQAIDYLAGMCHALKHFWLTHNVLPCS
jgi:hypothetical protein